MAKDVSGSIKGALGDGIDEACFSGRVDFGIQALDPTDHFFP